MNRLNKLFFIIFLLISCSKESVKYTLNIKINPTDGGYVNISNGEFSSGEQIYIKATASESYTFEIGLVMKSDLQILFQLQWTKIKL